jgi:hypothetical protein
VHEVEENVPWPPADQVTVPPGVMAAPASVSVTVAVHVAGEPTMTDESHTNDVEVCRSELVTPAAAEPFRCVASPP